VKVERFHLFEDKNGILTLPSSLKEADGIILAATVEWMGIGGLMQQFRIRCGSYSYCTDAMDATTAIQPVDCRDCAGHGLCQHVA
ncbi:MAG: hypothetical protein II295_10555, partial [Akkermansia sp.]|nr:hypothetical protein [Akkermansia sp.]